MKDGWKCGWVDEWMGGLIDRSIVRDIPPTDFFPWDIVFPRSNV